MPGWMRAFSTVNPLTYLVEGLRLLLLNSGTYGLGTDVAVLGLGAALMLALGTKLYPSLLY